MNTSISATAVYVFLLPICYSLSAKRGQKERERKRDRERERKGEKKRENKKKLNIYNAK